MLGELRPHCGVHPPSARARWMMKQTLMWAVAVLACVFVVARGLRGRAARGWSSGRSTGLGRGAATSHVFDLKERYAPAIKQVVEIRYQQRKRQDDSVEPLRITFL